MTPSPKTSFLPHLKEKWSNGLTVLYLHTPQDPVAACHLFMPLGAACETAKEGGLTTLMCALLAKGTQLRSAKKLAEDIESIGAYIGAGTTHDYSEASCHTIGEYFIEGLEIMAEMLFKPQFQKEEINKEKTALIAAIRSRKESIFTVTNEALNQHLYGRHPYSRPSAGQEASVSSLSPEMLFQWHKRVFSPQGAVLSVASAFPFEQIKPLLEKLFGAGNWPSNPSAQFDLPQPERPTKITEVRNTTHFEQAYLMMGFPAAHIGSEDYIPLKVLNGVLGGGMSARLFQSLREKQGLAYDVGAFYPSKRISSAFIVHMGLQLSRMEQAKSGIMKELEAVTKIRVPAKELEQVKNHVKGTFILDHQTNSQRAHYLGWWEILGLGADYDGAFLEKLDRVSPDLLFDVTQRYLTLPHVVVETHPKKIANNAA